MVQFVNEAARPAFPELFRFLSLDSAFRFARISGQGLPHATERKFFSIKFFIRWRAKRGHSMVAQKHSAFAGHPSYARNSGN